MKKDYENKNKKKTLNQSSYNLHNIEYEDGEFSTYHLSVSDELDFARDYDESLPDLKVNKRVENKYVKSVHSGHRERMYRKYEQSKFEHFYEHEILEMLLYNGYPRQDTNPIAHELLKTFGCLRNVIEAGERELISFGLPWRCALVLSQYNELYKYLEKEKDKYEILSNSTVTGNFCCKNFGDATMEAFHMISLDKKRRIRGIKTISMGIIGATEANPADVMRTALQHGAKYVVLCHNHPNGNMFPSNEDVVITNKIVNLLETIDIGVIDHIICKDNEFYSFAEHDMI